MGNIFKGITYNNMSYILKEITYNNNMSNRLKEITYNNISTFGDLSGYTFNLILIIKFRNMKIYKQFNYMDEDSENEDSENEDPLNPYKKWYDYWDETGHHTPYFDEMRENDAMLQRREWEQEFWECKSCNQVYKKSYMEEHFKTKKHLKHYKKK